MARTIYFLDGSREVLFCDEYDTEKNTEALEWILRERLGDDTANLLLSILKPEEPLDNYELACDEYRACLQDVLDGLGAIDAQLDLPRVNRKKLKSMIQNQIKKINNEL